MTQLLLLVSRFGGPAGTPGASPSPPPPPSWKRCQHFSGTCKTPYHNRMHQDASSMHLMHCTCWKDHYQTRGATTLPPHSGRWVCKTPPIPCVDNALCAWMCDNLKVRTFQNQQVFSSHLCQDSVKILTPKGLQSPNGLRFTSVKESSWLD